MHAAHNWLVGAAHGSTGSIQLIMNVADAAKVMQISERTIRRWADAGHVDLVRGMVSLRQLEPLAETSHQKRHARPRWAELRAVLDLCR